MSQNICTLEEIDILNLVNLGDLLEPKLKASAAQSVQWLLGQII